jgi:L-fucose isomerase-like protein
MIMKIAAKTTFAVLFGNRGFFPASLIASARREMRAALAKLGHRTLMLPEKATRFGAVETPAEGRVFADFLRANRGAYGGVILCLPNFGDETGAVAALQDAGVPILVQAYPDELTKMSPESRRDAFCGKLSAMDVLRQYGVRFTALSPHVVSPTSPAFANNVDHFDRLCRTVGALRRATIGAIGARTTPFKTVRIDELTLQKHGVTVETVDLSEVFMRAEALGDKDAAVRRKAAVLGGLSSWKAAPPEALGKLARVGVVLDGLVKEFGLDAVAVRCWTEMQRRLGVSPCVVMGELSDRGVPAACEVDVGSALAMLALQSAAGKPAGCLDWNNNYGEAPDKCILFHCGPLPPSMMTAKGCVADHAIIANAVGPDRGWGCNTGRIAPGDFTFAGVITEDGAVKCYVGEGRFTKDPIAADFFGCAGVAEIPNLQEVLRTIGLDGHRHHVAVASGHVAAPLGEALSGYLGFEVKRV